MNNYIPNFLLHSQVNYAVVIGLDGNYIEVNDYFINKFGFLSNAFAGIHFSNGVHPDDVSKCIDATGILIQGLQQVVEVHLRKPTVFEDKFILSKWEFSLLKNEQGMPLGVLCVGHDLPNIYHSLVEAEKLNQQADTILENLMDICFIINEKWEVLKVNRPVEILLQISENKIVGKSFWDFFKNDVEQEFTKKTFACMNEKSSFGFEYKDQISNRNFHVLAFPIQDGITVIFKDITHLKLSEEKLTKSETALRAILDSTTDSNFLIGADYKVITLNKPALEFNRRLFNKDIQEGDNILDYILEGTIVDFVNGFEQALAGKICKFEIDVGVSLGYSVWKDVAFYPVFDNNGQVGAVSFNSTSISKRKLMESKLIHQNEMLRSISWQQSHGIRKPLANILGLLGLVNNPDDPMDFKLIFPYLHQSALELDEMVKQIVLKIHEVDKNNELGLRETVDED